ncbi:MAG: hypothetical protein H0W89_05310 [Candidatus Levybacteria bacterium]|nr:hypothetical protein [Candidatus Levybacteria bacterium]
MRQIEAGRPNQTTERAFPLTKDGKHDYVKHALFTAHDKRMADRKEPQSGIIPPVTGSERKRSLDNASQLLTKDEPFTKADAFAFADAMQNAAGTVDMGDGEFVTVVPDIIPRTGRAEITIHTDGKSLNVVFQDVDTSEKGDEDRQMPKQTRYVLGENFGRGGNHTTKPLLAGNPHPVSTRPEAPGEQLDLETDGRKILMEIYVAHQTAEGKLDPAQAGVVIKQLHEGTPIRELQNTLQ